MLKRKKVNQTLGESSSFENSSLITNLELDNRALKAKNLTLVQENTRLQLEKAQQQVQIAQLQEEFFKINSCFVNLKNIFSTIDSTTKGIFPKLLETSEMFTKIMQLCSVGKSVSVNRDPRTLTVQPHTVNGHVIQHPTISLSRMSNDTQASVRSKRNSNNTLRQAPANGAEEDADESDEYNVDVERIVYRRRANIEPLNMDQIRDQVEEEDDQDNLNNDSEYCSRLFTIREENESHMTPPNAVPTRISREVKIFIDRLPSDYVRTRYNRFLNSPNSPAIYSSPESIRRHSGKSNASRHSNTIARLSGNSQSEAGDSQQNSDSDESPVRKSRTSILGNTTVISNKVYKSIKRRQAKYFGEPSSFLQPSEVSNNLSAIPSCSMSHNLEETFEPHNLSNGNSYSKADLLSKLGLTPYNARMTTSTPMTPSPRVRSRMTNASNDVSASVTPVKSGKPKLSTIKKKSRISDDKKQIPHVIINRMTLEKRLSGSPAKKISDKLRVPVITNVSQITQRKRPKLSSKSSSMPSSDVKSEKSASKGKENVDTSNTNGHSSPGERTTSLNESSIKFTRRNQGRNVRILSSSSSSATSSDSNYSNDNHVKRMLNYSNSNSNPQPKKSVTPPKMTAIRQPKLKTTGIRAISTITSPKKFGRSPRPKRAAKPISLKEPTLNTKMRRSK